MFQKTFRKLFGASEFSEGEIRTRWGRTWYCRFGCSSGVPLIVIHGGPGFPHNYLLTLQELSSSRPVVFYDQHGCGRSPYTPSDGRWSVDEFVEELDVVRRKTAKNGAYLLGHSWGAVPALEYSLGCSSTSAVVFASPFLSYDLWMADARRYRAQLPEAARRALEDADVRQDYSGGEAIAATNLYYERHVHGVHSFPEYSGAAAQLSGGECYRSMWGPNEFVISGSLKTYEGRSKLAALKIPVLFTCGRNDEASPESLAALSAAVPNSQSRVFELSAHNPHLSEASQYCQCLESFFKEVEQ